MSDETCCYCSDPLTEQYVDPGTDYHAACPPGSPTHRAYNTVRILRAQLAALALAHDAAMAEAEREFQRHYDAVVAGALTLSDAESARADAAEAALKRGVRELQGPRFAALQRAATVWEQRALAAEAQLAAVEKRARTAEQILNRAWKYGDPERQFEMDYVDAFAVLEDHGIADTVGRYFETYIEMHEQDYANLLADTEAQIATAREHVEDWRHAAERMADELPAVLEKAREDGARSMLELLQRDGWDFCVRRYFYAADSWCALGEQDAADLLAAWRAAQEMG